MKVKRIALLLDASHFGGIEQHVISLAGALQASGRYQTTVILWKYYGQEAFVAQLHQQQTKVKCADGRFATLTQLLRDHQIQVMNTHGYKANLIGRAVHLLTGVKVVATHHNGDRGEGRVRLYTWLDRMTAPFSTNWAVSEEIRSALPASTRLVPNFVSMPEVHGSVEPDRIVFVGRLTDVKRPDRFVELARRFPWRHFAMYGDGPLYESLCSVVPPNLTVHGFESDKEKIWHAADVCVICSETEGLPITALEAMARGVVVIATAVGQLPALIESGRNGWIADDSGSLTETLHQWTTLPPAEQLQMRYEARQTIRERYSAHACLPGYEQGFQSLIQMTGTV